jgi:hypothetical protein
MTTRYNVSLLSNGQQERLVELTEHLNEGIPLMTIVNKKNLKLSCIFV